MPQIDGILNIVVQQDATELRMGTARVPKLLRLGTPKRFMMPGTSEETLRELLGDLFDEERETELQAQGRLRTRYTVQGLDTFGVLFKLRYAQMSDDDDDDSDEPIASADREVVGFDVIFTREASPPSDDDDDLFPPPVPNKSTLFSAPSAEGQPVAAPAVVAVPSAAAAVPLLRQDIPRVSAGLAALLHEAVGRKASDLHICAGEPPVMRVDGRLIPLEGQPDADPETLLQGCLGPATLHRLATGASADLAFHVDGIGRFRLNIYRSSSGLAAALRVLPERAPNLKHLNLPVKLDDLIDLPHGLIIMTGPTGSGKSSTLAALVQEALDRRPLLVISLEDPIEFALKPRARGALVRQREVGRHVRDFATGLKDALREDPDILIVGEMRDPETIGLAMTAAETGHLVLTSMHSRSAAGAVERIVDSYPAERQQQVRSQLADALRVVVAQRLVPRAGGNGRIPALEVMRVTGNVGSMIREGKTAQLSSAIQSGAADGMIPLERCLADMIRKDRISVATARSVANDLQVLKTYIGR